LSQRGSRFDKLTTNG